MSAQARLLPDGRLHLHHGPIDLICAAEGDGAAFERAVRRFEGLLDSLVAELPLLRQPIAVQCPLKGPVARRMWQACAPHRAVFVTPMAAVAGAVAEAVLNAMIAPGVIRAAVNNGGDIALHLAPGAPAWRLGVVVDPVRPASPGWLEVTAESPVRGVATSGAKGRSLSLGIADSVTVLADDAPAADVAATLIANAVDLPADPAITRAPARDLHPDSDLGDRLVTVSVAPLRAPQIARALEAGEARAHGMLARGLIRGAVLVLSGQVRIVGAVPLHAPKGGLIHA